MKIAEKIRRKNDNRGGESAVTIAFFGDSITEGCFDVFINEEGRVDTEVDPTLVYHTELKRILGRMFVRCPINIINAGISGANIIGSLERIDRDVIRHGADLCVISFGSNDMMMGIKGLEDYKAAMRKAVKKLLDADIEVIVMSAPMNCTRVSHRFRNEKQLADIAADVSANVKSGVLGAYVRAAGEVANELSVPFLDIYSRNERLWKLGADVDALLANSINHPDGEEHKRFALELVDIMFG